MMLEKLEKYYRSKGIFSEGFDCRHFTSCSTGCEESFTKARSAFVGSQYELGTIPRLLIVSLDSGNGETEPSKRTPYYMRGEIESRGKIAESTGKIKGLHWRETHKLAAALLKKQFKSEITFECVTPYFCHVNSAKCCMNNPGNKQANHVLFENCREYLRGELEILKPNIIVSQGQEAKRSLHQTLAPEDRDCQFGAQRTVMFNGRTILWIATYHPSARQYYWNEKKSQWGVFEKAVDHFVQGNSM